MIPPVTHPCWKKVITDAKEFQSSKLALNLLVHNNRLNYKKSPTPANLNQLVQNTHEFFTKYEKVFGDELKQLLG